MNIRSFLSIAFILVTTMSLMAQGKFEFKKTNHDFGTVVEGNVAAHEFEFTNTGNAPIVISNVKASCGCTTPYWTKDPVMPGEKGKIKAAYNSKGRPGAFNKSITITSNASEPTKRLMIKGTVEKMTIEEKFSEEELAESPSIKVLTPSFNLGKVEVGQSIAKTVEITNTGNSDLNIKDLQSTCNCVTTISNAKQIKPGETVEMELSITPRLVANRKEMIYFFSNDLRKPKTALAYNIEVVKDLSGGSIMQNQDNSNPFK